MLKRSKIFQPKVIIGSITSFIVAAVGIVAVFFPSLLNLEKKSMPEKSVFLRSQDSLNDLYKFLEKNANKPVRLVIGYCHLPSRTEMYSNQYQKGVSFEDFVTETILGDSRLAMKFNRYIDHIGDNPRKNEEEELDVVASANLSVVYGPEAEFDSFNLENGGIAWNVEKGLYREISIPYESNKNKKYLWTSSYVFNDELAQKLYKKMKCPAEIKEFQGYELHNEQEVIISGIFFVHEQSVDADIQASGDLYHPYSEYQAFYTIELEPIDKKDLELRNY